MAYTSWCSGFTPSSKLRGHSWWGLGTMYGAGDQTQVSHVQGNTPPTVLSLVHLFWCLTYAIKSVCAKTSFISLPLCPPSLWHHHGRRGFERETGLLPISWVTTTPWARLCELFESHSRDNFFAAYFSSCFRRGGHTWWCAEVTLGFTFRNHSL